MSVTQLYEDLRQEVADLSWAWLTIGACSDAVTAHHGQVLNEIVERYAVINQKEAVGMRSNPSDATIRNVRASRARDAKLHARVKALAMRVRELEQFVRHLQRRQK